MILNFTAGTNRHFQQFNVYLIESDSYFTNCNSQGAKKFIGLALWKLLSTLPIRE
jgi:hypothetical protein